MKICPKCGIQMQDNAKFCVSCGTQFTQQTGQQSAPLSVPNPPQDGYGNPPVMSYDHIHEFTAKDISDNKVLAMLCYLMGMIGVIIALLGSSQSPYAAFHVRQALKFSVLESLTLLVALIFCWTFIVPIVCGLFYLALFIVRIICFFSICNGHAQEPPIIRSFGFLR